MKPIDSNVSPYLQQPLRTLEQVLQERARRPRQQPADSAQNATDAAAAGKTETPTPAISPKRVDHTI